MSNLWTMFQSHHGTTDETLTCYSKRRPLGNYEASGNDGRGSQARVLTFLMIQNVDETTSGDMGYLDDSTRP
jgi:hypothetical protein